jgi:hypothetical protein
VDELAESGPVLRVQTGDVAPVDVRKADLNHSTAYAPFSGVGPPIIAV